MIQKKQGSKITRTGAIFPLSPFYADCRPDIPTVGQAGPSVFKTWRIVDASSGAFTPAPDAGFDTATVTAL